MLYRSATLVALVLLAAPVDAQQARDLTPFLIADRAAEVALARSAAPSHVSDSATVLVLTRTGFLEAVRGSNGFTCAVMRGFNAATSDPEFWNPRLRAPHCLNPAAARTVLTEMLQRVQWIMSGVSPAQIDVRTRRAYASGRFPKPAPGAMACMLSHEQHLGDAEPHWMPHVMFYYDRSASASAWGAGGFDAPVIDGSSGDPHSAVLTLLIPVRQWSDGTPALPAAPAASR